MKRRNHHIEVRGARQHNLKDVSLVLPRDALIVVTGLSGSGKSSLAFDTLYAEGQRHFVESLSSYARQFLEQMQKPDVDQIEGLPPTVAIQQQAGSSNPRSTVATTTEIYDYLRALFARVGVPYCWKSGEPMTSSTVSEIVDALIENSKGQSVMVLAPIVRGVRGKADEVLEHIRKEGLIRVRLNGEIVRLDDDPEVSAQRKNHIDAVVDRLTIRMDTRARLADSVELALMLGDGLMIVALQHNKEWRDQFFSARMMSTKHPEVVIPEMTPRLFSFNSPIGACETCDGLGTVLDFDEELVILDHNLTIAQGAIDPWRLAGKKVSGAYTKILREFCRSFDVAIDAPYRNLNEDIQRILLNGTKGTDEQTFGASFEGIMPNLRRRWKEADSESMKQKLHAYMSESPCKRCAGARLNKAALSVRIADTSIAEVVRMNVASALDWIDSLEFEGEQELIAKPLSKAIRTRLDFMQRVGVGYLSLNRSSATLSGGESQRIRLATQVGSGLVGICYVLDEPTIGLHSRDSERLVKVLERLRNMGNTLVVVEHDEETIKAADHIVDMGPGAGELGGNVIATGSLKEIMSHDDSVTGQYLSGRRTIEIPEDRRAVDLSRSIQIRGARENNLQNIDVRVPLGCLVCVTGVSGSGKSTLVNEILLKAIRRRLHASRQKPGEFDRLTGGQEIDKVIEIDQSPIGRTPRSNPSTYVGVFDLIRQHYAKTREAKIRGYTASRFSFNNKGGRCESCQGQGTKRIEMHFLPDLYVTCDSCKGTRYNRETLEIRYRGKNIAEVLDMSVQDARAFFDSFAKINQLLRALSHVGLGYMKLGQSSTTLSGGEAQRVKLAAELGKSPSQHTLYILDEPTTGLHFADIHFLMTVLNRLVDQGNTVLVIEHNLDVVKVADWVIDLGPDGGEAGGAVVVAGTPEDVVDCKKSHTGKFLKARLKGQNGFVKSPAPVRAAS